MEGDNIKNLCYLSLLYERRCDYGAKRKMCISIQEMAQLLGIGMTSAYKLANDKEFYPAKRVCGRIVVHYDLLQKWIKEQNN